MSLQADNEKAVKEIVLKWLDSKEGQEFQTNLRKVAYDTGYLEGYDDGWRAVREEYKWNG